MAGQVKRFVGQAFRACELAESVSNSSLKQCLNSPQVRNYWSACRIPGPTQGTLSNFPAQRKCWSATTQKRLFLQPVPRRLWQVQSSSQLGSCLEHRSLGRSHSILACAAFPNKGTEHQPESMAAPSRPLQQNYSVTKPCRIMSSSLWFGPGKLTKCIASRAFAVDVMGFSCMR